MTVFSGIYGRGRIGADFLVRNGLVSDERAVGQVDSLDELRHPGFNPDTVSSVVRHFFEHTGVYRLACEPAWRFPWSLGVPALSWVAHRAEQFDLPSRPCELTSLVTAVRTAADGRERPRAWIRTMANSSRTAYVALYAVQTMGNQPYQTVAHPVAGGNVTSWLRVASWPASGLLLTSNATFFVCPWGRVRLPLAESIEVWSEGSLILARHRIKAGGMLCGTLNYRAWRTDE
jgi:hypothetical protein